MPSSDLVIVVALPLLMLAGLVAFLLLIVRAAARGAFGRERRLEADLGAQVIRERLARGEITREDAEAGLRALGRDLRGPA